MAGGGFVTDQADCSVDDAAEHIRDIEEHLSPLSESDAFGTLVRGLGLPFDTRDRLSTAAGRAANNEQDAAFLFGTFVGLELAALTVIDHRQTGVSASGSASARCRLWPEVSIRWPRRPGGLVRRCVQC